MEKLNELIDFYEMVGDDPELLVMLLELRRHRLDNWKQRAEAAEAKLAELEKQKPLLKCSTHTRAAPAADLAELVPPEADGSNLPFAANGWNACRAEMLRRIEEAK